jgi:hypothetical protein
MQNNTFHHLPINEFEPPVFLINQHATRAQRMAGYVKELMLHHPYFTSAAIVSTSAIVGETVRRLRRSLNASGPRIVVPVGGDTTFNQAAVAVEGTNNILCAIKAGNACNAPMNLQRRRGKVLMPHELLEDGSVQAIYPVEMVVDDKRRIAITIADLGLLSTGAQFLNGPLRHVPGYKNKLIRTMLHERTLLVGRTVLTPPFLCTEIKHDGQESSKTILGLTVANAAHLGHYAHLPSVILTQPGAFMFTTPGHLDLPLQVLRIQTGTMPGTQLLPSEQRTYRIGQQVLGSVDGQEFTIEPGQRVSFGISKTPIWALGLDNRSQT